MGNDIAPVLVTGAAGYLGSRVLSRLAEKGVPHVATDHNTPHLVDCDLNDPTATARLLQQVKPGVVVHCAAVVPKSACAYDDAEASRRSVAMVEVLAATATCRVVFVSSMTVYAKNTMFPVRECDAIPPSAGYGQGKWLAEQVLLSRNHPGDVALRLPGLFGLPRRSGLLYNAAKSFLLGKHFTISADTGIWGAMEVGDAAEYLARAACVRPTAPPQAVNLGYPGSFSTPDAVAEIADLCGVEWQAPKGKYPSFSMNLERLNEYYGLLPVTFRQRLAELVDLVRHDLRQET